MAVNRVTPRPSAVGAFEVSAPFALEAGMVYEVRAIRSFKELISTGMDVFSQVYEPLELSRAKFDEDYSADTHLVSLYSRSGSYVNIPDSFILSVPDSDTVDYGSVVMALKLGMLPLHLVYDDVMEDIKDIVYKKVGVLIDIQVMSGPIKEGPITYEQHGVLETKRLNNMTVKESTATARRRLETENLSLRERISSLENSLIQATTNNNT